MSLRIGRWKCTYRVMETQPHARFAVDAIETRVRRAVLDAYEATLQNALAGDPAVYVVRRLDVKVALHVAPEPDVSALARRWGIRMGAEAVRAISGAADSANLVRFENQADFIAHFVSDLLRDLAWQRWCYGAFAGFRHTPRRDTILAIFREHAHLLAAIFQGLARLGSLRAVLDLLDDASAAALWREAIHPPAREPDVAEFLVFIRAALRIMDSLALWKGERIADSELLVSYAATGPLRPDWTDRRALAAAVWSILRFAARHGHLALVPASEREERWTAAAAELSAALDWLDLDWLRSMLLSWPQQSSSEPAPRVLSRPSGATPNQARLLARLRQILAAAVVPLDRAQPDSESNALRLFAALAAAEPELAAHPSTATLITVLLAAWAAIRHAEDPIGVLQDFRTGRAHSAALRQPDPLRALAALGAPVADVLHELLIQSPIALRNVQSDDATDTDCAGLFLLVRAITEARLAPPAPVLYALGALWSGKFDDPGVAVWSGLKKPEPLDAALCDSLLTRVQAAMESRALIDPGLTSVAIAHEWLSYLAESWPADATLPPSVTILAAQLLRLWARWLRGFAHSSVPYLLRQFIRRPGRIELRPGEIAVLLRPAPLDSVLQISGYLSPTPPVSWLAARRVSFRLQQRQP